MISSSQQRILGKLGLLTVMLLILTFKSICEVGIATKYALLIGIGDYRISGLTSLYGPANDLPLIKNVLLEKFQFQKKNIILLRDDRATHTGLQKAFSWLSQQVKSGDFVYIHYCGHGSRVLDKDGDEYPGLFDQTWVPYGSRSSEMEGKDQYDIIDDELYLWLTPIFKITEHVVFVSDSCHSGSVTRGNILTARTVPVDRRIYYASSKLKISGGKYYKGVILIGASQDDGLAFEASINGKIHGLFSWYWTSALRQAHRQETWSDLFKRAELKVLSYFGLQKPQFQGDPDKMIFGGDIKRKSPRISISRVWNDGEKVRIEAGSLSNVHVGSIFRLYRPGEKFASRHPTIEITKVRPFFSEALAKGIFREGDLVIEDRVERRGGKTGKDRLMNLYSYRMSEVELVSTLWHPVVKPPQNGGEYLELPDNTGWFRKHGTFSPQEMEQKEIIQQGCLLTFKIKNNSRIDFYIYLLVIMDNGKVKAIFPAPEDRWQRAILPTSRELDLKNIVLLLLDRPGREMIKLIITEVPIDIRLWEQGNRLRGIGKLWGTIQFSITVGKRR